MTQYDRLGRLLTRSRGCTAIEIIKTVGTVSPHSRLAEMSKRGWTITRKPVPGKSYGRYYGKAPA